MKKILILLFVLNFNSQTFAAGGDSSSDTSKTALYDQAVKLVKRAGKLEKKEWVNSWLKLNIRIYMREI